MELQEKIRISQLCALYGSLLTEKQRDCLQLYHDYNTTLSEIAQNYGCSRQAVYDFIKIAENLLNDYEKNLHLYEKQCKAKELIISLENKVDKKQLKQLKDLWEID